MRLRYSSKALLIAFTVIAICIGMFGVRLHSARRQSDAVAALRAAQTTVWYKYETSLGSPVMNVADPLGPEGFFGADVPRWKLWLARRFGRDFVFDVNQVYNFAPLSADLIARLPNLRGLTQLHLNIGKGFNDAAWEALRRCRHVPHLTLERDHREPTRRLTGLARLRQLEVLEIKHGTFTREDAEEIARLHNLRELTLSLVDLTDETFQPLEKLQSLRTLHLIHRGLGDDVSPAGLAFIARMPALRSLTLARLPSLNDDVFSHLERLTQLESLNLDQATITGAELHRLARLPKLKELNLIGTQVDDAAMEKLAAFSQLEMLDVLGTHVTDAGLKHVAKLSKLRSLNIARNKITDQGLAEIADLPQLQELMIGGDKLSDASLLHLTKLSTLTSLGLGESNFTAKGVAKLKAALPECNVY